MSWPFLLLQQLGLGLLDQGPGAERPRDFSCLSAVTVFPEATSCGGFKIHLQKGGD